MFFLEKELKIAASPFDTLSPKNRPELSESCTAVVNVPIHKYYKTVFWRKNHAGRGRKYVSHNDNNLPTETLHSNLLQEKIEVKHSLSSKRDNLMFRVYLELQSNYKTKLALQENYEMILAY